MKLELPEFAMVVIIGTSGSGKSTFCRRHFRPTEVLSSDTYRGFVMDDEDSLEATKPAFEALHYMLAKRLELGRFTVVDATNVQSEARRGLLEIATRYHALKIAIVLDVPESVCHERNAARPNRQFGSHVVRNQRRDLRRTLSDLKRERWHKVYVLRQDQIDDVEVSRYRMWPRRPDEHGPFDIIGDVHGCREELCDLLTTLGWVGPEWTHPEGRKLVFVGDLVDRGPDSVGALRLVMDAVRRGVAICVPGNHDVRLKRALDGRNVALTHGLAETMQALRAEPEEFRVEVRDFIEGLVSHAMLDDDRLCVAHAGLLAEMQGRGSSAVRDFCLYGETTGEIDEFGLPVRYQWATDYRGKAIVVYGHTPVPRPEWLNGTIDVDTGCCFGGSLTALRYPERELVSVPSRSVYAEPSRPIQFERSGASLQQEVDVLLDIQDVLGRRSIEIDGSTRVTIREENAIAALEVMSRFAADPRWIVTLPPTMSPCEASRRDGFLEYPTEALDYFRRSGVAQVVCEEKHMGSRALAVVCRSEKAAQTRFGVENEVGAILTRTGRRFFDDQTLERALLDRVIAATERSGVFDQLESDWVLLDLELMPWSAKAIGLLKDQYGPVGASARASAAGWSTVAEGLRARGIEGAEAIAAKARDRATSANRFSEAYRRYCWTVESINDYKLAPFHLLASEAGVHVDRTNLWHMEIVGRICDQDSGILRRTPYRVVDLASDEDVSAACAWWEDLVGRGGEGMVVKPLDFAPWHEGRAVQPAVKCRGPEYLRIIYGPEYLEPENLDRLRRRSLNRKRALASREFALGIEALNRFVRREPLRRVHECVFGVLALESEPVDPRL